MRFAIVALVLVLFAAVPARASLEAGRYRVADVAAAHAALDAAIGELLAGLHPGMREVFTAELRRAAAPYRTLRVEPGEGVVRIGLDARALELPLDGSARPVPGPEGRRVHASQRDEGATWVLVFAAERSTREDRFTRRDDGLAAEVRLRASVLPRPLVYRYALVAETE